ncbi:MAG: hypothetical protein MUO31_06700 [Thermodesulfovibrionales bacterium]|nr:hypothetical protein [Thermodesulfovibrionales bacterium]
METTKSLNYSVWSMAVHCPKPLNYSVYCDSMFCQPRDAAQRARKIANGDKKQGASHVWVGVFCEDDGICYSQHYYNAPDDIDETISHISKSIL